MTQFALNIDPSSVGGTALAQALNVWEDAVVSNHKGGARPAYAQAGMLWVNDTASPWILNLYTGSIDVPVATVNPSTGETAQIVFARGLVGQVAHFARSTPPAGWLKANGALVSRTAYADLYAAIGTTFSSGDGSTSFGLPDLRGEFVRGLDDGRGVDASRVLGSLQAHKVGPHTHPNSSIYADVANSPGGGQTNIQSGNQWWANATPTGTNSGTETRPRNVALLACIRF